MASLIPPPPNAEKTSNNQEGLVRAWADWFYRAYQSISSILSELQSASALLIAHDHTTADSTGPLTNDEHDGFIEIAASSVPSTPTSGKIRLYAETANDTTRIRALHSTGHNFVMMRDLVTRVRNETGATLTKGTAVYLNGTTGVVPKVAKARADSDTTMPAYGIVYSDITNNSFGSVLLHGQLNMDTSAWADGDILNISDTTAGALTTAGVAYPNQHQQIALVVKSGAGNSGILQVIPMSSHNEPPVFAYGTYTPTLTNVANVAASTAYSCQYSRLGTIVTVSGRIDIDPTATTTLTQLGISLPIASNLANDNECAGTAAASGIAGQCAAIRGDATNNRAELAYIAGDISNQPMYFSFTYRII